MASNMEVDAVSQGTKVTAPISSQSQKLVRENDESEWEYEYSATETETFYVTLDLSKADFRAQDNVKSNPTTSRGGWPTHTASELFLNRRKASDRGFRNSAGSSAASSDAERDGEDQPAMSRKGQDTRPFGTEDHNIANRERVQILDLHTENPIISYKGRVFSGRWCENTTTELLMARHEANSSLPILRHLDNGVDLLAASCSRISVTEQNLKPKDDERKRQRDSTQAPITVLPPVDSKATRERTDQRNFLADLVALKKRKGETDEVTIIAQSMQAKRKKSKSKKSRSNRRGLWAPIHTAHPTGGLEGRPPRSGRPRGRGRGRGRGKWALFQLEDTLQDSASVASSAARSAGDSASGISTPTPSRWDELEEAQGDSSSRAGNLMEVDMDEYELEDPAEEDEDEAGDDEGDDQEEEQEDQDFDQEGDNGNGFEGDDQSDEEMNEGDN